MKFVINDFYCLNCGKKTMSLPRKHGHQHEKFHRKKLYCPYCKIEINNIEIKNEEERWQFLRDFEGGVYEQEKLNDLSYLGYSGVR